MARPTRTNAEYFYHPSTFRNDRRVKAIRARYGACGYGLLMMLIELLTDAENTALPTDEMEIELLAGDLSATVEDVTNLIQAAEKVGLFARTNAGLLKCPQLDEWLAPVFEKRNRSRNTATASNLSQPVTETTITVTETPPVKERTEQDRTGQEIKESKSNDLQAAASPAVDLTSSLKAEKPNEPRGAAEVLADEASVFTIAGFRAFVNTIGMGKIDLGFYLPQIQYEAGKQPARPNAGPGKTWEAFVKFYLNNERKYDRLTFPPSAATPGSYAGPNPALQVTTTSTSYSREAIAARNVTKY